MKKILYGIFGVVIFVLVAALVAPFFINLNDYKPKIAELVKEKIGRELKIDGSIRLGLLPAPSVTVENASLSGGQDPQSPALVKLKALTVDVELWPLLKKKVIVKKVLIRNPEVHLEKLSNGKGNWEFELPGSPETPPSEEKKDEESSFHLSFDDIEIIDGSLTYKDQGSVQEIKELTAKVSMESLKGPYETSGFLKVKEQPVHFKLKVKEWASTIPLKFEVNVLGNDLKARGDINLEEKSFKGEIQLQGNLESLKKAGLDLSSVEVLHPFLSEPLVMEGNLFISPEQAEIQHLEFKLKEEKIKGNLRVAYTPLKANLSLLGFPGSSRFSLEAQTAQNVMSGNVSWQSEELRKLVAWLHLKPEALPEFARHKAEFSTDFIYDGHHLHLNHLDLGFQRARLKGQVALNIKNSEAKYDLTLIGLKALLESFELKKVQDPGALTFKGSTAGSLQEIKTDSRLSGGGLEASLKGSFKNILTNLHYQGALSVQHPSVAKLMGLLGHPTSGSSLGALKFKGSVAGDKAHTKISDLNLSLQMGHTNVGVSGDLGYQAGVKPLLKGHLEISPLDLKHMMLSDASFEQRQPGWIQVSYSPKKKGKSKRKGGETPSQEREKRSTAKERWSREPLDLSFLNSFNGKIHLTLPRLAYEDIAFRKVSGTAEIKEGTLQIPDLKGEIFGGAFKGDVRIEAPSLKHQKLAILVNLNDVPLERVVKTTGEIKLTSGILNLSGKFHTSGQSLHDFISNLGEDLTFTVRKGAVSGFNLKAISDKLKNLNNLGAFMDLFSLYMKKGTTQFSSVEGHLVIRQGVARIDKLALIAEGGEGRATGSIDLPRYQMDVTGEFSLTDHKDLPPFKMHVHGVLDDPQKDLELGKLQEYMMKNIFDKLVKGNLLKGGNIVENIVGGLVGTKGKSQEGSTPPAGDTANDNAPPLEKALEEPAKALKNVLKGLF